MKHSDYILRWAKKIRAINLLGGKCDCCGKDDILILTFHHENPEKKDKDISSILYYRWGIIEKEINKCRLLCRNCHRKYIFP